MFIRSVGNSRCAADVIDQNGALTARIPENVIPGSLPRASEDLSELARSCGGEPGGRA